MSDLPNEDERKAYAEYLSNPLSLPPEFKTWLADYLAVNVPYIPVEQLMGYKSTKAVSDVVNQRDDTIFGNERVWWSLDEVGAYAHGPELTGLANGVYFVGYGYHEPGENAGGASVQVGISVNNVDPTRYMASQHTDQGWANYEFIIIDMTTENTDNNNTLTVKYWWDLGGGANACFQYRWLTAMRVT